MPQIKSQSWSYISFYFILTYIIEEVTNYKSVKNIISNNSHDDVASKLGKDDYVYLPNQNANEQISQAQSQVYRKQLRAKILFAIQGLGSVAIINSMTTYVKGPHCQASIKDLVKYIRGDKPSTPFAKIILNEYNIVESDLLQLLILHVQDQRLSFWLIILLSSMTEKVHEDASSTQAEKIEESLLAIKEAFIRNQCFTIIMLHIAEFLKIRPQDRFPAHMQMVEFSILLIRNLLQVKQPGEKQTMHARFIVNLVKQDFLNPILYLIQVKNLPQVLDKIDFLLLNICYHIFTCIKPQSIYQKKQQRISISSMARKIKNSYVQTGRHSNFSPVFQSKKLPQSDKCLISRIFPQLEKKLQKVTEEDIIQYILLCRWAVLMANAKYHSDYSAVFSAYDRSKVQFSLSQIVCIMHGPQFDYIFKLMETQVTKRLRRMFKYKLYHSALALLKSYLQSLQLMQRSNSIIDRKNATTLMGYMFKHQISKILKEGLQFVVDQSMIKMLIIVIHRFFSLLQNYTQGRAITVTTNRQIKVKSLKNNQKNITQNEKGKISNKITNKNIQFYPQQYEGHKDIRIKNTQQSDENKNTKTKPEQIMEKQYQQLRFHQRRVNYLSQLASLSSYKVIQKYLFFLKRGNLNKQQNKLHQSIFYFFSKIVELLKGEWLFFQAQTLCILTDLLSSKEINEENKELIKHILKQNRLALVESLFEYQNLSIKDQILRNYSERNKPIQLKPWRTMNNLNQFTQQFPATQNSYPPISSISNTQNALIFGDSQFIGSLDTINEMIMKNK